MTQSQEPSPLDVARLLLVGPCHERPTSRGRFAGHLLTAEAFSPQATDESDHGLVALALDDWPRSCGLPLDLPLLAFGLGDSGETMEVVLAGLEAGRNLSAIGVNLLLGPSLRMTDWRADEDLTAQVADALLEGLMASDLVVCVDAFPAASAEDLAGPLRAYPLAFAHGVEAVRLAPKVSVAEACSALRDELGFRGVIAVDVEAPDLAPGLLEAGCDLLVTSEAEAVENAIESALETGALERRRVEEALRRLDSLANAWL